MANSSEQPDKHLDGEGHAHHQFNPERAEEFHDQDRLKSLKLDKVANKLDIDSGQTLLDLGTGSGALLPWLSSTTAPEGVVIGADINNQMLSKARSHVRDKELNRVVLLQNNETELTIVTDTIDRVLIISSLHEFSDPCEMIKESARVLNEKGVIGILEWRYAEMEEGPPIDHRLKSETIDNWLDKAGLELSDIHEWSTGYDLYVARLRE